MQDVIDLPTGSAIAVRPDHQLPLPATATRSAMAVIERIMNDPSVAVDRIHSAFDFYERMQKADARRAFEEAMALAKAEMPTITKDRAVYHKDEFKYKHEDLAGIAKAIGPVLARHGLSYRWRTASGANIPVTVTCIITHAMGHSEENSLSAGADASGGKNSIQAIGSVVTYLQRYTLKAALGLAASHDDDGGKADERVPDMVPDQAVTYDDVRITGKQIEELTGLIAETKSSIDRFLKFAQVGGLDEIKSAEFSKLKNMLLTKRSQVNAPR